MRAGSSFRDWQKVVTNGGVERKLALALVPLRFAAKCEAPSLSKPRKDAAAWGHAALPWG